MTTLDAAFLAEVDEFLSSCDSPTFSLLQALVANTSQVNTLLAGPSENNASGDDVPSTTLPAQSPSSDPDSKCEAKIIRGRKRRIAYHERQKCERMRLQLQVQEMAAELEQMQKTKEIQCAASVMAWRTLALQQLQARNSSELQQYYLQAAIESQARLIQEFCHFAQQRLESPGFGHSGERDEDNTPQQKRIRLNPSDIDVYEQYVQELEAVYKKTDAMIRTNGFDEEVEEFVKFKPVWKVNDKTGHFESVKRQRIPYHFRHASQTLWQLGLLLHQQENSERYDCADDPENTVAVKFRITKRLESGRTVSAFQRIVGRRYQEQDRVVIVWRAFAEGEGIFCGMHSDETGWCVIQRSSDTSAILDMCMRNVPMHFSSAEKDQAVVDQFAGLVCNSGSLDFLELTNSLDRMHSKDS